MGFVNVKHKITGIVQNLPEHYLEHPVFGDQFELTDDTVECYDCVLPEEPETILPPDEEPETPVVLVTETTKTRK